MLRRKRGLGGGGVDEAAKAGTARVVVWPAELGEEVFFPGHVKAAEASEDLIERDNKNGIHAESFSYFHGRGKDVVVFGPVEVMHAGGQNHVVFGPGARDLEEAFIGELVEEGVGEKAPARFDRGLKVLEEFAVPGLVRRDHADMPFCYFSAHA
jgi:hypothetical protein